MRNSTPHAVKVLTGKVKLKDLSFAPCKTCGKRLSVHVSDPVRNCLACDVEANVEFYRSKVC